MLEGALLLGVLAGSCIFAAIVLDHVFSLGRPPRTAIFVTLAAVCLYVFVANLLVPMVRSVSRLYVARRIERAFPHFKDSLTTFVEMPPAGRREGVGPLVAHRAAGDFEGVDVDAGLDAARFMRLGYAFVVLVLVFFGYSLFATKSMWASFVRVLRPWTSVAAPTRTHIADVTPGDAKILQGSDFEVSARISGVVPQEAGIRWSRDGELWQSAPMAPGEERWVGLLDHVETDITYFLTAGDAASPRYAVKTLVPPIVESVSAELVFPAYTRLEPRRIEEGNIEALVGTEVRMEITSNKELKKAALLLPADEKRALDVTAATAMGRFRVKSSGRYSVDLTDTEGLTSRTPVRYDLLAIADQAPTVKLSGPPEGAVVALDEPIPFTFEAGDDYGLSRLAFRFQTDEGDASAKTYVLPGDQTHLVRRSDLVPELLGARPGDTISYYLEAYDNRSQRPNSSRTANHTFTVASEDTTLMAAEPKVRRESEAEAADDSPGDPRRASGEPEERDNAASNAFESVQNQHEAASASARSRLLNMIEKDRNAWETIERHLGQPEKLDVAATPRPARPDAQGQGAVPGESVRAESTDGTSDDKPVGRQGAGDSQLPGLPADTAAAGESTSAGQEAAPGEAAASGRQDPAGAAQAAAAAAQEGGQDGAAATQGTSSAQETRAAGQESTAGDSQSPGADAGAAPGAQTAPPGGASPEDSPGEAGPAKGAQGAPSEGLPAPQESSLAAGAPEGAAAEGVPAGGQAAAAGAPSAAVSAGDAGAPSASSSAGPSEGPPGAPGEAGAQSSSAGASESGSGPAAGQPSQAASGESSPDGKGSAAAGEAAGESDSSSGDGSAAAQAQAGSSEVGGSGGAEASPNVPYVAESGEPDQVERPVSADSAREFQIRATRELVGQLARDLADRRPRTDMLEDLGWQPGTLRTFVRQYEEVISRIEPEFFDAPVDIESHLDPGRTLDGRRGEAAAGATDTGEAAVEKDPAAKATTFLNEQVREEYQKIVEEYRRSLAETAK